MTKERVLGIVAVVLVLGLLVWGCYRLGRRHGVRAAAPRE